MATKKLLNTEIIGQCPAILMYCRITHLLMKSLSYEKTIIGRWKHIKLARSLSRNGKSLVVFKKSVFRTHNRILTKHILPFTFTNK